MSLCRRIGNAFSGALAFAAFAFAPAQAAGAGTGPHPALWRIENGSSTVYVFGSFHILRRGVSWITPALVDVLGKVDSFVFEVPVTEKAAMADAQDFIDTHGYLPEGQTLSGLLSAEALTHFKAVVAGLSLKPQEVEKLRPWLAQLTLSSSFYEGQKFSVLNGADVKILGYAVGHKKPVRYLETPRQQLEFFADAAAGSAEVNSFETLLQGLYDKPQGIDDSTNAWVSGDVDHLSMGLQHALEKNPKAKKILLDDRNAAWASAIEGMLTEGKTVFVTVGVGHLGGPGSVFELLCSKGYAIARLPAAREAVDPACPTSPRHFN